MKRHTHWALSALLVALIAAITACAPPPPPPAEEAPAEEPAVEEEAPAEEAPAEEEMAEEEMAEDDMAEEEAAPAAEGDATTVIIGTTDQISSLDFADAYAVHDWELFRNVNLGLMTFEPGTANVTPGVAADFPEVSEDGLTYTFTLSEGWAYPDGTPLVAGDFVRGINRTLTLEGDVAGLALPYIENVEAPDDQTVVFTLTQPYGYFTQIVTGPAFMPVTEGQYPEDALEKFPESVYGVGAWQITEYVTNEQLVLEPNPNFAGERPAGAPERVIIRYYEDPTQMSLAVENGEIDIAWRTLGPLEAARLGEVDGLTLYNSGGGGIRYLLPNHSDEIMQDKNVRQALAYLIDRDEIIDRAVQGQNDPLYSMVPPGFIGANEAFLDRYPGPDVEAAEELLAASGYTEEAPLTFDLWYPPEHYGTYATQIFQILEEQFEATPLIEVNLQTQEWSTYIGALTNSEYPIGYLGWFFDYPDSSNYLEPFAQSLASPNLGVNYASEQMDALLAEAGASDDPAERAALYEEAQALYAEDVVTLPISIETEYAVFRADRISNVVIGPAFYFQYELIEFAN